MITILKFVLCLLATLVGFVTSAANDDCFVCCSTLGPDSYADGTPVADGEAYALVYTKPKAVFAGFQADGKLVDEANSEIALVLPRAKDGCCPATLCVISRTYANRHRTGTWDLFLLDTRRASGRPAGMDETGALRRVNSWGRTNAKIDFSSSAFTTQEATDSSASGKPTSLLAAFAAVTSELSALPADVVTPRITGISVHGERVLLAVDDTVPYLTYDVAGASSLESDLAARVAVEKRDGAAGETLVIEADATRARFFKVVTDR